MQDAHAHRTKWFGVCTVVLAAIITVLSVIALQHRGPLIWLPFAFAISACILHVGAAIMVWRGLHSFKAELQHAYRFICIAVIFVGFTQLQLPVISIFGWWELRESGLIIIPFILPFIFFAIGIRKFAILLTVKTGWTSPWRVNLAGLALGLTIAFVPHVPNNIDRLTFAGTMIMLSWIAVHALALVISVLRIKDLIGVRYINAMAWLCITYISVLATTLAYMGTLLLVSPGHWYVDYNVSVAWFVLVGLLWVRTGVAFTAITEAERAPNHLGKFFGPSAHKPSAYPSVDIIIYLAEQASDLKAIDPILDPMRGIMATAEGRPISSDQQAQLIRVFKAVETYLTVKDPLRTFNRQELRANVELSFPQQALQNSFWPLLQQPTTAAQ